MLTEARTTLVCASLQVGALHSTQRFSAVIAPADMDLVNGRSVPTKATIDTPTESALALRNALDAHRISYEMAEHEDSGAVAVIKVNFGYDTLTDAIRKLAELIWKRTADDPRYWFSFGETGNGRPDMCVVDVQRSHHNLEIYQNMDSESDDQPLPAPFSRSWWINFQSALNDSELCLWPHLVVGESDERPTHIELRLTDEAAANFEHTLQTLMQLAPRN